MAKKKPINADPTQERSPAAAEPTAKRRGRKKGAAAQAWTFPKNSLEEAILIAKAIEDINRGNPMRADLLVRAVGLYKPNDWRFLDVLRSANLYGLVSGSGQKATVSLEKIGRDVVAPGSPKDRKDALLSAFHNVAEFKKVDDFYGAKRIPEDE